jgi:hypothetical protein
LYPALLHWKRCALFDSTRVNSPIESNCFRPLCSTVGVEEVGIPQTLQAKDKRLGDAKRMTDEEK